MAAADIIPSGYKSVATELLIAGTEHYPDKIFVLYPARFGMVDGKSQRVAVEVKKGANVRFYHLLGPQLYALPAGTDFSDPTIFQYPSLPRSSTTIRQIGPQPHAEQAKKIRRVYRITGISGNKIELKQEPDQRFDGAGKPLDSQSATPPPSKGRIWPLAGIVGLPLVLGYLVTRGRRGRKRHESNS